MFCATASIDAVDLAHRRALPDDLAEALRARRPPRAAGGSRARARRRAAPARSSSAARRDCTASPGSPHAPSFIASTAACVLPCPVSTIVGGDSKRRSPARRGVALQASRSSCMPSITGMLRSVTTHLEARRRRARSSASWPLAARRDRVAACARGSWPACAPCSASSSTSRMRACAERTMASSLTSTAVSDGRPAGQLDREASCRRSACCGRWISP